MVLILGFHLTSHLTLADTAQASLPSRVSSMPLSHEAHADQLTIYLLFGVHLLPFSLPSSLHSPHSALVF